MTDAEVDALIEPALLMMTSATIGECSRAIFRAGMREAARIAEGDEWAKGAPQRGVSESELIARAIRAATGDTP